MTHQPIPDAPRFSWNAGGWGGTVLGCTLWLGILGTVLLGRDPVAGATTLVSCALLLGWSGYLWRSRRRIDAYTGIQRLLLGCSLVYAVVIATVNLRGASESPLEGGVVSTFVPWWLVVFAPLMMLYFRWMKHLDRPSESHGTGNLGGD